MDKKRQITARREALFLQSDFFKKLMDYMQIGVIVADARGHIIYINDTYARFLRINAELQIGKHATEVVSNTRLHIVAKTGIPEINYPHEFNDIGYLVQRVPLKEKDRVIAVLGLVLFEDAPTVSRLVAKLSVLESKVKLYENELASLRATRYTFDNIVSKSHAMDELKKKRSRPLPKNFPCSSRENPVPEKSCSPKPSTMKAPDGHSHLCV